MYTVKQITAKDLDRFVNLAPEVVEFYSQGNIPGEFKLEIFLDSWRSLLATGVGIVFGLFNPGPIGLIGAVVAPDIMGGGLVVSEAFWFVSPQHRGGGKFLLEQLEDWAKEQNAKRIITSCFLTNGESPKLGGLFERRGYKPMELHYVKEL